MPGYFILTGTVEIKIIGEVPSHNATKAVLEMEDVLRKYRGKVIISKYRPKEAEGR